MTYVPNESFGATSSIAPSQGGWDYEHKDFRNGNGNINSNPSFVNNSSFVRGEAPPLPKEVKTTLFNVARVTRSKEECSQSYSKMAKFYDVLTSSSEREFTDVGLQQLDVQPGERVLEIGCGTGYATSFIANKVGSPSLNPAAGVCAVDISQGMIDQTRSRLEKEKLLDRVTLICGDALKLPFANNTFDAIFLSFVVELFDNDEIPQLIAEIVRVLKPGTGRFTVVALVRKVEKVSVRIYEWFHKKMPNLVDCRPIHIRETLATLNSLLKITKHSEHSMWSLPVEVVTARKKDDDEVADFRRRFGSKSISGTTGGGGASRGPNVVGDHSSLVMDVAQEAEKMILMERDSAGAPSPSNHSATSSGGFDRQQQQQQQQHSSGVHSHHQHEISTRESILGDPSAIGAMSEFGVMKVKTVPRSQWMEDDQVMNCVECKKEFGLFTRKHHCRACGIVVCAQCCSKTVKLNTASEPQKVCQRCYDSVNVSGL